MLPALAGDCLEIKFDGSTPGMVIIDGGMGKERRAILKKDVCDWKDKNGPVDLAVLTHLDNDHISGFLSLIKDEKINDEYLSEMWFNYGEKIEKSVSNYDKTGKVFLMPEENTSVTERELDLCGYFVIVTSDRMTAKEALYIYKSRDFSEKAFRGDKTYLGDKSLRVHSTESTSAKIFVEFVAMIIRNKMYTCLTDEMNRMGKKQNYMTVPAAIRELEKIEMTRQTDNVYRLDHGVTAMKKEILNAFGPAEKDVEHQAMRISEELR